MTVTRAGGRYADIPVNEANSRCLLNPLVLARLIQAARIAKGERVLVVGCTTGYSAAVVARLARATAHPSRQKGNPISFPMTVTPTT